MRTREEQIAGLKKLLDEIRAEMPHGPCRDKDGKLVAPVRYPNIVEAETGLIPELVKIPMPANFYIECVNAMEESQPKPSYNYYQDGEIKISDKPISVTIKLDKTSFGH